MSAHEIIRIANELAAKGLTPTTAMIQGPPHPARADGRAVESAEPVEAAARRDRRERKSARSGAPTSTGAHPAATRRAARTHRTEGGSSDQTCSSSRDKAEPCISSNSALSVTRDTSLGEAERAIVNYLDMLRYQGQILGAGVPHQHA